jgi:hypothetical protein
MKVPCENCMILPICRHKTYQYLMRDCCKIFGTIYQRPKGYELVDPSSLLRIWNRGDGEIISYLERILKPSKWYTEWSVDEDRYRVKGRLQK